MRPCSPLHRAGAWSPCVATNQLFLRSSYNEFYFLTHPALFIEDHFPDNKNWQLLKPPQSLRQFENNMYHKSEFYNKGMLSAHPETPVVRTGNPRPAAHRNGATCSVHLGVPAHMGLPCQSPSRELSASSVYGNVRQETEAAIPVEPSGHHAAASHTCRDRSPLTPA